MKGEKKKQELKRVADEYQLVNIPGGLPRRIHVVTVGRLVHPEILRSAALVLLNYLSWALLLLLS